MLFTVDLNLTSLRCVQPEDSEDEPYLWTFFFTLDGSTVRQPMPGVMQLVGNVTITAGHGAHGNLGVSDVVPPRNVPIPANVGHHSTTLRPIRLRVGNDTIVIPGRLVAFCVLMEEDATDDDSILKAHGALRNFLETEWNTFLATGINQQALLSAMGTVRQANPQLGDREAVLAAVQLLIDGFVDGLEDRAAEVVEDTVIDDSSVFELIANFVDADDSMGTLRLSFDERQIINENLAIRIFSPIIGRDEDGVWTSYYEMHGGVSARLIATNSDTVSERLEPVTAPMTSGEYAFDREYLCIPAGTIMTWTISGVEQEHSIRYTYPWLPVRWTVNGTEITTQSGTERFTADCSFPVFDASQPPRLTRTRHEQREVGVRYETQDLGDEGKQIRLWNHRDDGTYGFIVEAQGLLPNGATIPLLSEMVSFSGQRIDLGPPEVISSFRDCMEQVLGKSDDYAKSKKPSLKDLWGNDARFSIYEELIQVVDAQAAVRGLTETRVSALKAGIARKLNVQRRQ